MSIYSITIRSRFRSSLALSIVITFFAAMPLMTGQTNAAGPGSDPRGMADQYVNKKKHEYLQRTDALKSMLRTLGGVLPPEQTSIRLPKPATVKIVVKRKGVSANPPAFTGKDYIGGVKVGLKGVNNKAELLAVDELTANVLNLHRYVYLDVKARINRVKPSEAIVQYTTGAHALNLDDWVYTKHTWSLGYDAITTEDVDMSMSVRPGKDQGDKYHFGLEPGDNMAYSVAARGLAAIGAGAISPPKSLNWKRPDLERVQFLPPSARGLLHVWVDSVGGRPRNLHPDWYHVLSKLRDTKTDLIRTNRYYGIFKNFPTDAIKIDGAEIVVKGDNNDAKIINCFFNWDAPSGTGGRFLYRPKLNAGRGSDYLAAHKKDWRFYGKLRKGAIGVDTDGGPFQARKRKGGWIDVGLEQALTGKTRITAYLLDSGGKHFPRSITFTANRVERITLDAPLTPPPAGLQPNTPMPHSLAVGAEYPISVKVTGPAAMEGYHVRWYASSPMIGGNRVPIEFEPRESPFKHENGVWTASAMVRIPDTAGDSKQPTATLTSFRRISMGSISADICLSNGSSVFNSNIVYRVTSPIVTGVVLRGGYGDGEEAESRASSGTLDLFIGSGSATKLYADVALERKLMTERKSIKLPALWIKIQQDSGRELTTNRSGWIMAAGGKPGTAEIRAVIRKKEADRFGINVNFAADKDFITSEPLKVTINRPYLISQDNGANFRLAIDGPADMGKYFTKWTFSVNGRKRVRSGVFVGNASEISTRLFQGEGAAGLESVRILDNDGQVVAFLTGIPMIAPVVTLTTAGGAFVQGMEQKITADITRLPVNLAPRTFLRWSFSGATPVTRQIIGNGVVPYTSAVTYLQAAGGGYRSSIVVNYPEDLATAGKKPMIRTELILKERAAEDGKK